MAKITLVYYTTGEHEDKNTHVACAYARHEDAASYVSMMNDVLRTHGMHMDQKIPRLHRWNEMAELAHALGLPAHIDYTGSKFYMEEVTYYAE